MVQQSQFSVDKCDKIDLCFLKHHATNCVPMTVHEMEWICLATKVKGFRTMRHVSHRVFVVGLAFWYPLPKEQLCEWEDIALRLSLGLIWNLVSEMRSHYHNRVRPDGKEDAFHHFIDYLKEMCVEDDVVTRACLVRSSCQDTSECEECKAFVSIFEGERACHLVAMANRNYFHKCVNKEPFDKFQRLNKTKKPSK